MTNNLLKVKSYVDSLFKRDYRDWQSHPIVYIRDMYDIAKEIAGMILLDDAEYVDEFYDMFISDNCREYGFAAPYDRNTFLEILNENTFQDDARYEEALCE